MKRINQRGNEANDEMIGFMKPAAMVHATGCNEQRNWLQWATQLAAMGDEAHCVFTSNFKCLPPSFNLSPIAY